MKIIIVYLLMLSFCHTGHAELILKLVEENNRAQFSLHKSNFVLPNGSLFQQGSLQMQLVITHQNPGDIIWAAIRFDAPVGEKFPWAEARILALSRRNFELLLPMTPQQTSFLEATLKKRQWPAGLTIRLVYGRYCFLNRGPVKVVADWGRFFQDFRQDRSINIKELHDAIELALSKGILQTEAKDADIPECILAHLRQNFFSYILEKEETRLRYRGNSPQQKRVFYLSDPVYLEEETLRILPNPPNVAWEQIIHEHSCNLGETAALCEVCFSLPENLFKEWKIKAIHIFPQKTEDGKKTPGKPLLLSEKNPCERYTFFFRNPDAVTIEYRLRIYPTEGKNSESSPQKLGGNGKFSLPQHYETLTEIVARMLDNE